MRLLLSILLLFSLNVFSDSIDKTSSSKRYPDETFEQAAKRIENSISPDKSLIKRDTPIGKRFQSNRWIFL